VFSIALPTKCDPPAVFLHAWSPDGKQIGLGICSQSPDLENGLWILNVEKKEWKKIASGDWTMPAWSPDGSKIAVDYRDFRHQEYEVWVIETKNLENAK
jgi:Tol biopolymer transport system component